MIIMADNFISVATSTHLLQADTPSVRAVLYAILAALITPLCLPRRLGRLHAVSVLAFCCFMFTAVAVVLRGVQVKVRK